MGNELQKLFSSEELTPTQKMYPYIDNLYMNTEDGFDVANQMKLYEMTPNVSNIQWYSRLGHFTKGQVLAAKINLGEEVFKQKFMEEPENMYQEILKYQNSHASEMEARSL